VTGRAFVERDMAGDAGTENDIKPDHTWVNYIINTKASLQSRCPKSNTSLKSNIMRHGAPICLAKAFGSLPLPVSIHLVV
jgi:hypothetical protein